MFVREASVFMRVLTIKTDTTQSTSEQYFTVSIHKLNKLRHQFHCIENKIAQSITDGERTPNIAWKMAGLYRKRHNQVLNFSKFSKFFFDNLL